MGQAARHLNILHQEEADGYISIVQLDKETGKAEIRHYKHNELKKSIDTLEGQVDMFMSPNTFYVPSRKSENVRQFRTLFIECDVEQKTDYFITEAYYEILTMSEYGEIPRPSEIVFSGRGFHCYWVIDNAPKQAHWLWQEIQDRLYYKLKHLGADKQSLDVARILRVPETINSKNNKKCEIIFEEDNRYSLYEIIDEYLQIHKKIKAKNQNIARVIYNYNSYSLHYNRLLDIQKLCELRN